MCLVQHNYLLRHTPPHGAHQRDDALSPFSDTGSREVRQVQDILFCLEGAAQFQWLRYPDGGPTVGKAAPMVVVKYLVDWKAPLLQVTTTLHPHSVYMKLLSLGRWDIWRQGPTQHSTDALANWEAKVKAKVDWIESSDRLSNNETIHRVIPYLTCVKCHALPDPRHDAYPLTFDFVNQNHMSIMSEQVTRQWADRHPAYEFVGYWPRVGWEAERQIVSILVCYRLNYLPITDCFGEGRSLRAARAQAAEKLLRSGHCVRSY